MEELALPPTQLSSKFNQRVWEIHRCLSLNVRGSAIAVQKTIVEEESDSDFDSDNLCPELAVLFPDKIEKIQSNKLAASQVPRLNMMKVRQLMKKNRAKMDNEMKKNAHHNPTEKIIMYGSLWCRLENELDYTRR